MPLKIRKKSKISQARIGELQTAHGVIQTPFFMPIATRGAVKGIASFEIEEKLKSEIILSNTYHLLLAPGMEILKKTKGLHDFMQWSKPILTDSGGFQVFSLGKLRKITEKGVKFKNPKDGKSHELTPENVIKYQNIIGSDIMMVLDECTEYPCSEKRAKESMEMSLRWAERCKKEHDKLKLKKTDLGKRSSKQLLFGIVQGSVYKDLRKECAERLVEIGFDGYALGGVSVGATAHNSYEVLDWVFDNLPYNKPRYVMGMGTPKDIIEGVKRGVDMFDCVIPTREGRHGRLFTSPPGPLSLVRRRGGFYSTINITNAKFKKDFSAINKDSKIPELREYSKAYLYHLFKTNEVLGSRLASLNNLEFYLDLMKKIREEIKSGRL